MEQIANPDGLPVTASNPQSVELYEQLITANFCLRNDLGPRSKQLLAHDPDMPMALCVSGYFAKLFGNRRMSERATQISARLAQQIETSPVCERERLHAAALAAWCRGRMDQATEHWEQILLQAPLDGLAARLSHFTHFYSGDGRAMRDSVARILPHWPEGHRNRSCLLGCYAFGLEESREYEAAERLGREAAGHNPADAWSVHAVAHVLEMQGRTEEGIEWVRSLGTHWGGVGNFRYHLYWHQALYYLEHRQYDEVLALYDEQVAQEIETGFYLDLVNAASLLYRLERLGVSAGDRWQALATETEKHLEDEDLVFLSLHHLMILAAMGDRDRTEKMVTHFESWARQPTTQGEVCAEAGLPLARAMAALQAGRFDQAAEGFRRVRYRMDRIGGSAAQRDVFELMMLDAARQGSDPVLARALYTDRVARRPGSPNDRAQLEQLQTETA